MQLSPQQNSVKRHVDVSLERKSDDAPGTIEKDLKEESVDLVLVEKSRQEDTEQSVSPVRDERLQAVRSGTAPVVKRVHKNELNKIGQQIREYQNKLR